ncbi:hypothetical protein GCM10011412_00420 [Maribacter cobaltidurans]|nr:hypothetical protein GCM10011412_00420 [Maribacter cobaltidurans]
MGASQRFGNPVVSVSNIKYMCYFLSIWAVGLSEVEGHGQRKKVSIKLKKRAGLGKGSFYKL